MLLFKFSSKYDIEKILNLVLGWSSWLDFYNKLKNAWFAHLDHQLPYYHSHKTKENYEFISLWPFKKYLGMKFLKTKNLIFGNFVSFHLQTRIIFKPFLHHRFFHYDFIFLLFFSFSFYCSILHKTLLPDGKWENRNKSMICQML
jgi:hypothetical protein